MLDLCPEGDLLESQASWRARKGSGGMNLDSDLPWILVALGTFLGPGIAYGPCTDLSAGSPSQPYPGAGWGDPEGTTREAVGKAGQEGCPGSEEKPEGRAAWLRVNPL